MVTLWPIARDLPSRGETIISAFKSILSLGFRALKLERVNERIDGSMAQA